MFFFFIKYILKIGLALDMSVQLKLFIWPCTCVENGNNQTKVFIKYILQYSIALGQFSSVISKRYTELKNNEMSENLLGIRPLSVPFLICTSGISQPSRLGYLVCGYWLLGMQKLLFSKTHLNKMFCEKTQYSNMNFGCFLFTPAVCNWESKGNNICW